MKSSLSDEAIKALVFGYHSTPFDVLGIHKCGPQGQDTVIRTMQPFAAGVDVVAADGAYRMGRLHKDGLFEYIFTGRKPFKYRLRITGMDNHVWEVEDAYRFPFHLTDFDLHVFNEGTNYKSYVKMGAHPLKMEGVDGVHFAVWAPNALRVSVIGAYNRWHGLHQPMQRRSSSGVWEIFVPHLKPGDLYKFEIKGPKDHLAQKSDPYAFASELRPKTASVVWDNSTYAWNDRAWMERRAKTNWHERPVSVYEVHLSSWRRRVNENNRWLTYREFAEELIGHVKYLGFTHIELLPISEHPFDGSWGYQTIGYYSPTSRYGTPDDFKFFVDRCHAEDIGVIVDWVPAHFPKDGHGLAYFDGTHLYEHADPRKGEHRDWGTLIFNYGRNEVRSFLLSNAVYWADLFHIDGFRVDAVASMLYLDYSRKQGEWIPNQFGGRENLEAVDFIKKFNEVIHQEFPGILTFAEESTAWPMVSRPTYLGGLGFGLKWNMGWMHDMLEYMSRDPIYRRYHHNNITFSLLYAFNENFILPFSHDEVVHGKGSMLSKMPGDLWQKFANLRCLYAFMYAHPGKKLLFMGAEIGQWNEWNHRESLDWHLLQHDSHRKLQHFVSVLNQVYQKYLPLHQVDFSWEGFEWVDFRDADNSIVAFMRKARDAKNLVIGLFNYTPVLRHGYRLGVPHPGAYELILNSDAVEFGGSGAGQFKTAATEPKSWHGHYHSITVTLPPLAGILIRYLPESAPAEAPAEAPAPRKSAPAAPAEVGPRKESGGRAGT
jgi:1,4-alpha-glucan branching enzyme